MITRNPSQIWNSEICEVSIIHNIFSASRWHRLNLLPPAYYQTDKPRFRIKNGLNFFFSFYRLLLQMLPLLMESIQRCCLTNTTTKNSNVYILDFWHWLLIKLRLWFFGICFGFIPICFILLCFFNLLWFAGPKVLYSLILTRKVFGLRDLSQLNQL